MKFTNCKSCGKRIVWAILPSGKNCPVDAGFYTKDGIDLNKVTPYTLETDEGGAVRATALDKKPLFADDTLDFRVSHFATCPNAAKHSKKVTA